MTTTELRATPRGFLKGEFVDHFGATCSDTGKQALAGGGAAFLNLNNPRRSNRRTRPWKAARCCVQFDAGHRSDRLLLPLR